jgi:hypothetical protein
MSIHLSAVPPVIENGLPDLSTIEGSHALLPCTAKGSPEPAITWEKDGHLVSGAEGKFTLQPSGELLVKNSEVRPRPKITECGPSVANSCGVPPASQGYP